MNVYIPVTALHGLDSPLSRHFGSAPNFTVYDTREQALVSLNGAQASADDLICPCGTPGFPGCGVNAVLCVGMGDRAWRQFSSCGVPVYATQAANVGDAVTLLQTGWLTGVLPHRCCLERRRATAHTSP